MEAQGSKIHKYKNIDRGMLRTQIYYSSVKYAFAIMGIALLNFYFNISMTGALFVGLGTALVYIRFVRFPRLHAKMEILAIEVSKNFFLLDCIKKDHQINYKDIESYTIKPHEALSSYDMYIRMKPKAKYTWPKELIDGYLLVLPGVFEEDLFYIIDQSLNLKKLCKNYEEAQSFLEHEPELKAID